jgi:outer membrane protein OmpA-like peptidoglycan-associated protein
VPAWLVFGSVFTAQKAGRSSLLPVLWPWSHLLRERERGNQVRPDEPSVIFHVGLNTGGQRKESAMYIRMSQGLGLAPDTSLSGSLRQPPTATAPPPVTLAMRVRPFAVFSGFELDSAVVRGQANERKVDQIARHVATSWSGARPVRTIRLVGHTDSTGTMAHNLQLGAQRAAAVAKKVVDAVKLRRPELHGRIAVVIRSAGETRPVASNRSLPGRMQNRRVEIFLSPPPAAPVPPPPVPRPRPPSATEMRERAVQDRPETPSERVQRIIEEYSRSEKAPGKPIGKVALDKLEAALASRGLPKWTRRPIRWAVERGSKALFEQVMTTLGLNEQQKEAARHAVSEALGRSWW